jgi:hypothetical protein
MTSAWMPSCVASFLASLTGSQTISSGTGKGTGRANGRIISPTFGDSLISPSGHISTKPVLAVEMNNISQGLKVAPEADSPEQPGSFRISTIPPSPTPMAITTLLLSPTMQTIEATSITSPPTTTEINQ